jgi:AraC-like DNA-binding protein
MRHRAAGKTKTPVFEALTRLEHWLERDGATRIIVAQSSLAKLKKQSLPDQVRATPRPLRGRRKVVRGRRHYHELHTNLARWPDDGLDENVQPFIVCVIAGQADFHIADYVLHCSAGDWVFFPGGIPKQDGSQSHFEGDPTGRHCDVLWINPGLLKEHSLHCWICRSQEREHFKEKNSSCRIEHRFLAQLFNGFCDEIQERNHPAVTTHLLRGVLLLMKTAIAENNAYYGSLRAASAMEEPRDPIDEAQLYIIENIHKPLTIQVVARQALISPSTLTHRFRERTGQTFNQFLNAQRLQLAAELLQRTDLPIAIISQKVGLQYGQLRVLFQQNHGCSPGQFRACAKRRDNDA